MDHVCNRKIETATTLLIVGQLPSPEVPSVVLTVYAAAALHKQWAYRDPRRTPRMTSVAGTGLRGSRSSETPPWLPISDTATRCGAAKMPAVVPDRGGEPGRAPTHFWPPSRTAHARFLGSPLRRTRPGVLFREKTSAQPGQVLAPSRRVNRAPELAAKRHGRPAEFMSLSNRAEDAAQSHASGL